MNGEREEPAGRSARRQRPDVGLDLGLHLAAELLQLGRLDRCVRQEQAQEAHLLERQLEREALRHRGDGGLFAIGFGSRSRRDGVGGDLAGHRVRPRRCERNRRIEGRAGVVPLHDELAVLHVQAGLAGRRGRRRVARLLIEGQRSVEARIAAQVQDGLGRRLGADADAAGVAHLHPGPNERSE